MKNFSRSENRVLFLILLMFEIFHLLYLVLSHRIPIGHDGFQYFTMQYFFVNDSAVNGEVPLWIPFMNHGITATWWYTMQGSINLLTNALFLAGRTIASINFQNIFHYGIFVDRLVLLTGVWLLGQRYFESAMTRFWVASCVMGSTVAMTQFNFTLHLYYGIPLIIYFIHTFLDTGRWRFLFLASNFFVIQTFGKNADTLTIVALAVFLYFLLYALDQPTLFFKQIKDLRWGTASAVSIAASLLSLGLLVAIFTEGRDPAMVNLNVERNLDASVPLGVFLTYAGNMDFHKWHEWYLRISPFLDFTVYMGFFAVPLIFFGLFWGQNRIKNTLALTILILFFFSMGTWVSVFFYYVWPMMKFYRHLALITPIIKLYLIFLAGFGFEKLFIQRDSWQGQKIISSLCVVTGVALIVVSAILASMSYHGNSSTLYINNHLTPYGNQMPYLLDPHIVSLRLGQASIFAMLTGLIFLLLPLSPFKKFGPVLVLAALLINTADIYGYYWTETNERTFVLNKDQYKITAFTPTPYVYRRLTAAPNPRQEILLSPAGGLTLYATINAFLFQDPLATRYRTIVRMKPLQDMVTAFGPNPLGNAAFLRIAGSTVDKIQLFDKACFADDTTLSSYLGNPHYQGNVLLLSPLPDQPAPNCTSREILTANDRVKAAYHIGWFTPNTLQLSVDVSSPKPLWMMYADTWHRRWKARLNGHVVPVFKADMAYKAVLLPPGKNIVQFAFVAPKTAFLEKIIAFNCLFWLCLFVYLVAGILRPAKYVEGGAKP